MPTKRTAAKSAQPRLLSGGNPQIAKGEGGAPVRAYIAAIPGWKQDAGRRLDALISRTIPQVRKAVKWNSPFYGLDGNGWFLSWHCFTRYLKLTFFRGSALQPPPPGGSKHPEVRYLDIHEGDAVEGPQLEDWIRQAAALPGWDGGSSRAGGVTLERKPENTQPAAELITQRIAKLGDWRGETLGRVRALIRQAVPDVVEEVKWKGTPVWSRDGIICTGEVYKTVVKLTFARGAALDDPARLFNSSLDGRVRRAIDIGPQERLNPAAFKKLIRQAAQLNRTATPKPPRRAR